MANFIPTPAKAHLRQVRLYESKKGVSQMERREKLMEYLCQSDEDGQLLPPLIDELLFLENQLTELKKLPFLKIHPNNPALQKSTPAAKQYRELLQQYTNIVKVLGRRRDEEDGNGDSPLRAWIKNHADKGM